MLHGGSGKYIVIDINFLVAIFLKKRWENNRTIIFIMANMNNCTGFARFGGRWFMILLVHVNCVFFFLSSTLTKWMSFESKCHRIIMAKSRQSIYLFKTNREKKSRWFLRFCWFFPKNNTLNYWLSENYSNST